MSLPSSFTIRPRHDKASSPSSENDESNTHTSTSRLPIIQLSFSGQENDVGREQKPPTRDVTTDDVAPSRGPAIYPRTDEKAFRRCIRVSPFQPMVHLRKMPRHGTISSLKVHEYEIEQMASAHLLTDEMSPSSTKCPPMAEVRIHMHSPSFDYTLSSPASESTFTDYKALYFQSQKELRALQKLQERTLGENRLLRSRIKTLMIRRSQEDRPSEASRLQDRRYYSQHGFPPRSNMRPMTSSFSISGESRMRTANHYLLPVSQARAPRVMQGQASDCFAVPK